MEVKGNSFTPRPIPCTQTKLEVFKFDCEDGLIDFGPTLETFCFEIDFVDRFLEYESLEEEDVYLTKSYVGNHFGNSKKSFHHKSPISFFDYLMKDIKSADKNQPTQENINVP